MHSTVGYYFNPNFEIEGNFGIALSHEFRSRTNFDPFFDEHNVVVYNYDANLTYNLNWRGFSPFLTAGIGGITRDSIGVHTDFAFNFGAGVKMNYDKFGLRFDVKDRIVPDYFQLGTKKHVIQVQSGIIFTLP